MENPTRRKFLAGATAAALAPLLSVPFSEAQAGDYREAARYSQAKNDVVAIYVHGRTSEQTSREIGDEIASEFASQQPPIPTKVFTGRENHIGDAVVAYFLGGVPYGPTKHQEDGENFEKVSRHFKALHPNLASYTPSS